MKESTDSNQASTAVATAHKSYEVIHVDKETGEETIQGPIYFEGRPREYRFNGQNGQFNLYGDRVLMDASGRMLASFSFQPIAYRVFEDTLFGRDRADTWAEMFFIDTNGCVASVMLSNTSVTELMRLLEPILYERKALDQVVLTIKPERVTSKQDPTKSWFVCKFSYEPAKPEDVKAARDFVKDHRVYRAETLTASAQHKLVSQGYYLPDSFADLSAQQEA